MSFEAYLGTSLYDRPTRPAWNAVSIQSRFLRPLSNMLATAVSPAGPAPMMATECMCVRGDGRDARCGRGRPLIILIIFGEAPKPDITCTFQNIAPIRSDHSKFCSDGPSGHQKQ